MPASVAVPLPLFVKVTPPGSAPVSPMAVATGTPLAVMEKVPGRPTVNVVAARLVKAAPWSTVIVNDCVAFGVTPLAAVTVIGNVPPAAAVPPRVAVPLPLSAKVMPPGNAPVSVSAGAGKPVVVIVKGDAVPVTRVSALALVISGACRTVRVNNWVAAAPTPLVAEIVIGYVPPVPAPGVPASVAVPSPLLVNETPAGSAPVDEIVAAGGAADVVTVKVPAAPTLNVVAFALVMDVTWFTVSVKDCVALGATPFAAVRVSG